MRILILGGIAESKQLAQTLIDQGQLVIYSIVGLVRQPDLNCEIHLGGFSQENKNGIDGLAEFCRDRTIDLLLDATHPYAAEISAHAVAAAGLAGINCWRFNRPGWQSTDFTNWHDYRDWDDLLPQLLEFHRPFFTLGASTMAQAHRRPSHQSWIIRCARPLPPCIGITQINAIGPFNYDDELNLMQLHDVDVLISKNSGCSRVADKLDAAMALDIPLFVQQRPFVMEADKNFDDIEALVNQVTSHS